jgi:hypothetical protein
MIIIHMSNNSKNLIISSYFFKKFVHPEKHIYLPKNDFNVIKNIYTRAREQWNDADVRIFHDGLDQAFISRYSKKWIKFIYVDTLKVPLAPKDLRLIFALDYIKENPHWDNVFIVDSLSVKCINNPFNTVNNNINSLFIASEKKTLLANTMFLKKLHKIGERINESDLTDRPTLNSDILGGHRDVLIPFLEAVQQLLERLHLLFKDYKGGSYSIRHTMIAVNYVALFTNNLLTGHPLHTQNKNYQMHGNAQGNLLFTFE